MLISIEIEKELKVFRPYKIRIGGEVEHKKFLQMLSWAREIRYYEAANTAGEFLKLLDKLEE